MLYWGLIVEEALREEVLKLVSSCIVDIHPPAPNLDHNFSRKPRFGGGGKIPEGD